MYSGRRLSTIHLTAKNGSRSHGRAPLNNPLSRITLCRDTINVLILSFIASITDTSRLFRLLSTKAKRQNASKGLPPYELLAQS